MTEFIHYDLVNKVINDDKKSIVNIDILLDNVCQKSKKPNAIFSRYEVATSIIKELYRIEEKYPNIIIIDLYTLELNNFNSKFPNIKLKLKIDQDYYPLLTPDISLNPPIDPIYMYEMLSHPDLDIRNMSKIRNINYIISSVNSFLLDYNLDCKLNHNITNNMILLLKNNNFKMKTENKNLVTNINITNTKSNGIGYGGTNIKWDINAYLDNIIRIKKINDEILNDIVHYITTNHNTVNDLFEIHTRFNLNTFWIDLIEKYEITEEKYHCSIKNILIIMKQLKLKLKIPFFEQFITTYPTDRYNEIKDLIKDVTLIEENNQKIESNDDIYVKEMKELQFGEYEYVLKQKHIFTNEIKLFTSFLRPNASNFITKQYAIIHKSLPLTNDSGIFFRKDESNLALFKFLIIPNEDTPYKYGCFVFDVLLPQNFPHEPPKVSHTTSRKNNFRFNPNLYSDGKVCLSLLGTWSGHQSENWVSPNADGTGSTLLQVMLSIYSMIFTENPWFNEPGRESGIANAKTNTYSLDYNKEIMGGTINYAILNQLKYPEEGFEDVIKVHFKFKKDKIRKYLLENGYEKHAKTFDDLIK